MSLQEIRKKIEKNRKRKTKKQELEKQLLIIFQKYRNKELLPSDILKLLPNDINKRAVIRVLHELVKGNKLYIQYCLQDIRCKTYRLI